MRCLALVPLFLATGPAIAAVPSALQPPAGATEIGRYPAHGDQIYTCSAKEGGTPAWVLKAPEAWLTAPDGKRFIHHYAGPTWAAADGSTVTGRVLAKAPVAGAVPELLLEATERGAGVLAGARFVQRLDTKGGVAPAEPCSAGTEQRVPYSATYVFWR